MTPDHDPVAAPARYDHDWFMAQLRGARSTKPRVVADDEVEVPQPEPIAEPEPVALAQTAAGPRRLRPWMPVAAMGVLIVALGVALPLQDGAGKAVGAPPPALASDAVRSHPDPLGAEPPQPAVAAPPPAAAGPDDDDSRDHTRSSPREPSQVAAPALPGEATPEPVETDPPVEEPPAEPEPSPEPTPEPTGPGEPPGEPPPAEPDPGAGGVTDPVARYLLCRTDPAYAWIC